MSNIEEQVIVMTLKPETKQVIVMRNDLNMRKGKMSAQAAHSVSAFLLEKIATGRGWTEAEILWLQTGHTKICVRAETEAHLVEIYNQAKEAGLEVHIITDEGRTEFDGPTRTCLAIGPDFSSKIDPITGTLKLL